MTDIKRYLEDFRVRIAAVAVSAVSVFLLVFMVLGYAYDYNTLRDTTGASQKQMARLMAAGISTIIDKEIKIMRTDASNDVIYDGIKDADSKYASDEGQAQRYLEDMDKKWIESPDSHPLIKGYLENRVSARLKGTMALENKLVNILVADRFGGLVGAGARISGFYQGSKEWWKKVYAEGEGSAYSGSMAYDEKAGLWYITMAIPVKDRAGAFMGSYCSLVDIGLFFKPLEDFKVGRTGLASLVDDKGYLVYQQGVKPFANKFCNYEELRRITEENRNWLVIDGVYARPSKVFISSAVMDNKLFIDGGINWRVFVTQDAGEVFAPVNRLLLQTFAIGMVIILLTAITAFKTADIFMGPVRRMKESIDRITHGELDHRIDAGGEAQLGALAASINKMVATLKSWAVPIANLDREIYLRKAAEQKLGNISKGFAYALSGLARPAAQVKEGFELILDEMPKTANEKHKKEFTGALDSVNILYGGIDKLLDVANMEAGMMKLNRKNTDIRAILKDIIFRYEPRVRNKGLDFKLDMPKEPVDVFVDPAMITKVFSSLLDNAVRLTEKGYVELVVADAKDDAECTISDTGPGIKKEDMEGIFGEFNSIKNDGHGNSDSIGVGLAIAKEIIEMHGGHIWVSSDPGKITKFTFRLPKAKKW